MLNEIDLLLVERIGGLAGFGVSGSRISSRGQLAFNSLPDTDQRLVEALFKSHGKLEPTAQRDTFSYRISCASKFGAKTVEVPETLLPATIIACVKDELI
jgi:hypothetical protein